MTYHAIREKLVPGQRLELALEGMGELGECHARVADFDVYVFGGIPGERVVAEVVRCHRRHAAARVVEVVQPSPYRVTPPCAYFWPCTGCQWQHIGYDHQLQLKQNQAVEALRRFPDLQQVPIHPTIPSPQTEGYRNHARFTIGPNGTLGFVNRTTRQFVHISRCPILHPWINDAMGKLQTRCAETTQLSLRYGVNTGDGLIQPALKNPAVPLPSGQPSYIERILDHDFRIASPSFFQVNTLQAERLLELVRERLRLTGQETLVDAYAGVGTFAVLLAPLARRVLAIEESVSAIRDARDNVAGLKNVEFLQGRTENVLAQLSGPIDAVILDPPRAGCHREALRALKMLAPRRIVYVSCDPVSLARDLHELASDLLQVDEVQPIDMFPHTHHVECVATLSAKTMPLAIEEAPVILASASPRRRELLGALGVPFTVVPPHSGEERGGPGADPVATTKELALAKAQEVARRIGKGLVIGGDTLVVLNGTMLGKPSSKQEAGWMLRQLRGRTHEVVTGVAVVEASSGLSRTTAQISRVTMRYYSDEEIDSYVALGEPLDKAGAYAVQDPTFHPVEQVEGCYLNVVGLPLCALNLLLGGFGVTPKPNPDRARPEECANCQLLAGQEGSSA